MPVFATYGVVGAFENTLLLVCKLRFSQSPTPSLLPIQSFSVNEGGIC
jgi:hypothetical protein